MRPLLDSPFAQRRRPTLHAQAGFTLMELLVVLIILAILMSVAVGSFIRLRNHTEVSAAELNVREARSAAELYFAHNDSYAGMTLADMRAADAGVRLAEEPVIAADGKSYCLESTHNGRPTTAPNEPGHNVHHLTGPGGDPVAGHCPSSL